MYTLSMVANAQVKIEKESKVMRSDVPSNAVSWVEEVFDQKNRMNWFFETSGESKSYEAKFYHKKKKYSVEFSMDGTLEDIEVLVHWRRLPKKVKLNISKYFSDSFLKTNIRKIQIQYTGRDENLKNWIVSKKSNEIIVKYEVEFYGKTSSKKKLWEGLFDKEGELLMKREIILTPSNNLFF
jgi:anionic cell wall polymer biosynthesis LytR-Cps2A-Psr (LCP) family protein